MLKNAVTVLLKDKGNDEEKSPCEPTRFFESWMLFPQDDEIVVDDLKLTN